MEAIRGDNKLNHPDALSEVFLSLARSDVLSWINPGAFSFLILEKSETAGTVHRIFSFLLLVYDCGKFTGSFCAFEN